MDSIQVIRDFHKSHLAPESTIQSIADEASEELAETLLSSNAVRDRFIVNLGQVNDRYEQDIADLDAKVASIPPSLAHLLKSKELKRQERIDQRNSRKRLGLGDDAVSVASLSRAGEITSAVVAGDEKNKLQSRETILAEMEKMNQYEVELKRKLLSNMTDQEQKETATTLLRLQITNADRMVSMITSYRPSFNGKKRWNKTRNGSQTVEDILREVRASRECKVPSRSPPRSNARRRVIVSTE